MQPSLERFPPHSTRQLYLLLHRHSMPQPFSKISLEGQKMQNWQVLNPPPSCSCCSSFSMENGHLLLICSSLFAPEKDAKSCQNVKASLTLSVGKLLFFVLSSLKQDQKITPPGNFRKNSHLPNFRNAVFWSSSCCRLPGYHLSHEKNPALLSVESWMVNDGILK